MFVDECLVAADLLVITLALLSLSFLIHFLFGRGLCFDPKTNRWCTGCTKLRASRA